MYIYIYICFTLIWLFKSSRKIYMSHLCQIFVIGINPPVTLSKNKIR